MIPYSEIDRAPRSRRRGSQADRVVQFTVMDGVQ
jgi:hypothetical protein